MENIITYYGTYRFHSDVETRWQSIIGKLLYCQEWKKRVLKSKFKAMLIGSFFFHINSIVITKCVPEDQTVNQTYYLKVLAALSE